MTKDKKEPRSRVHSNEIQPYPRTGAILIGGAARRLNGIAKGMIRHSGQPIICTLISLLKKRCGQVFLVGAERSEYRRLGVPIYPDVIRDRGSPGGVYSALYHADHSEVLIVACDMPGITLQSIDTLVAAPMSTHVRVFRCEGRTQPLFGVWQKGCCPILKSQFERTQPGFAQLLSALEVDYVDSSMPSVFTNLNTPMDVKAWRR